MIKIKLSLDKSENSPDKGIWRSTNLPSAIGLCDKVLGKLNPKLRKQGKAVLVVRKTPTKGFAPVSLYKSSGGYWNWRSEMLPVDDLSADSYFDGHESSITELVRKFTSDDELTVWVRLVSR